MRDRVYLIASLFIFIASISIFICRKNYTANHEYTAEYQESSVVEKPLMVDINCDDSAELSLLPGIGEKTADKIIEYRKKNGDFSKIEDIMKVEGIKKKRFTEIKEYIYVRENQGN